MSEKPLFTEEEMPKIVSAQEELLEWMESKKTDWKPLQMSSLFVTLGVRLAKIYASKEDVRSLVSRILALQEAIEDTMQEPSASSSDPSQKQDSSQGYNPL